MILLGLSGCHVTATPHAVSPGGELPIFIRNNSTDARPISIDVIEGFGRSVVQSVNTTLDPDEEIAIETGRLPHGDYTLRATADPLSRETNVIYGPSTQWYRFVIHEDVIAFQQRG